MIISRLNITVGHKIKASALGYAIAFLLLVGLICSGVLFVASVNKRLERTYSITEHLIFDNYFALQYGSSKKQIGHFFLPHPSGDTSEVTIRSWGAFKAIAVTTFHGNRKEERAALVGELSSENNLALYLSGINQALKICGETKIEGDASLPLRGIERAYIAGKNYTGTDLVYGKQLASDRTLPSINSNVRNLTLESFYSETKKTEWFDKDSSFSFHKNTSLVSQLENITIKQTLKGNIILHSFDSIYVRNTASLENVILIAPRIRFEKGFRGSVQAIAHEHIICEEGVFLSYPSVLVLNEIQENPDNQKRGIFLEAKSKVLGGALLVSQNPTFHKPVFLKINDALIAGLVYNSGNTEVIGTIAGTIYTQQFYLKAGGGEYINHLLDAKISSKLLPEDFVVPNWILSYEKRKPILLTCF